MADFSSLHMPLILYNYNGNSIAIIPWLASLYLCKSLQIEIDNQKQKKQGAGEKTHVQSYQNTDAKMLIAALNIIGQIKEWKFSSSGDG